jgi:hypothetical protein
MSIKASVQELQAIRAELKLMNEKRKKLKEREKEVEATISEYLRAKEHPGVKHQGTAIVLEEKEARVTKKAKERDADAISILQKYGIADAEKALEELMEARKGEKVLKSKLQIKKYKDNV